MNQKTKDRLNAGALIQDALKHFAASKQSIRAATACASFAEGLIADLPQAERDDFYASPLYKDMQHAFTASSEDGLL